jgi:hypothetical protein
MSHIKEPKYFILDGKEDFGFEAPYALPDTVARIANREDYEALFERADPVQEMGEASTWYLHSPLAAKNIHDTIPSIRLIAILRDPVQRALSNFYHNRNYLRNEPESTFEAAVQAEPRRREQNWGHPWYYMYKGCYYQHLKRYYDRFDAANISVHLFRDLKTDPELLLKRIYRFLQVDDSFVPDFSRRFNVSRQNIRIRSLHTLLNEPHHVKRVLKPIVPKRLRTQLKLLLRKRNTVKPQVSPALRRQMISYFRDDILQLQDLIGRDLSSWLS